MPSALSSKRRTRLPKASETSMSRSSPSIRHSAEYQADLSPCAWAMIPSAPHQQVRILFDHVCLITVLRADLFLSRERVLESTRAGFVDASTIQKADKHRNRNNSQQPN